MQTKSCASCGEPFTRRPKYSDAQWSRATFCSNRCRGVSLALERPLCACGCGKPVKERWRRYLGGHFRRPATKTFTVAPVGKKRRWFVRDRSGRRVQWARVVMEGHLRRELLPAEVVHHINGDSEDDRIENLQLYASHAEHMRDEYRLGRLPAMH